MSRNRFIPTLVLLAPLTVASASDFNKDVAISFSDTDDTETFGIGSRYFFDTVDSSRGPLAEATFLDRTTNIGLAYSRSETNFSGVSSFESDSYSLRGTYALGEQGLYLTGLYNRFDTDFGNFNAYTATLGYYLQDDWDVSSGVAFDDDGDFQSSSLASRKLFDLGGDKYLALGGAVGFSDDFDDSFSLNSTYYFNRNTSVGFSYSWTEDVLDLDDGLANIAVSWFVTPTISISASTSIGFGDVDADAGDFIGVGMLARF